MSATVYNKNGSFNLQGLLVNPSQSVSSFTKLNNAFKAYNSNLSKSTQLQNAYIQAVGKQNTALGNYLAGLDGAKASMGGYVKSLIGAKAATIGLQVASVALNVAISLGLTLVINALVSSITNWINKEKEAREEAIENAKAAKEESNNLSELLNKYNQLSREVKSNQGAKEDLLNVQSDLLEALGIEAAQIDDLIEKYGDLNTAINQITLGSLRDAQGDLMVAVDAYEKDLISAGKSYAHWYSMTDRNILNATGGNSVKAFEILEKSGVISSGSYGTGGGALVLTGDDTVEGILENYRKLKDAQEALNAAIDSGEITMEEMIANPLYQAINARLDQLNESIGNYDTAIDDLNKNIAQQQILQSLSEQSSIPDTKEEFEAFQQSMIDAAIASTRFKGTQDDIKDSIINVLSTMPEFEKYFEELTDIQSSTLNNETPDISKWFESNKDSIDDFQSKLKTLGDALSSIRSGEFSESDFTDLVQEFNELDGQSENLEEAIISLINKALKELKKTLGEGVSDDLLNSLQSITNEALGLSTSLHDAFSDIHDSWDILHDFKDTMDKGFDSNVTDSLLQSVRKLSGELETLVAGYYSGVVSAEQIYEALTQHYENDLHNYSEALIKKNELNEDFYNAVGLASEEVTNQFMDDYDVDIKNCTTYNQAKLEIEKQTLGKISAMWSQYYDAQSKTLKLSMSEIEARATHGGGDAKAFLEQYELIENYEAAIEALNNITYDGIRSNFEGIGSKLSANSGSSSSSSTKSEFEETVDFFERRVDVLSDALSLLETNLDNVTGAFAKNNLIDAELELTEEKFKNYSNALNMYTQKANESLSKLPSDIAQKIRDGAVALTDFVGDGNKDVVDAIKDYESWADKIADCKEELAELKTAIRQLELQKFNNIVEDFTNAFDLRENGKDLISKQIDLLKESGELIGESFFTAQIDQSKKQLALLEEEKAQLVNQMSSALSSGRVK